MAWANLFADWATDRGHSVTAATFRVSGTPCCIEARKEYEAGASDDDIYALLDDAYRTTERGETPSC